MTLKERIESITDERVKELDKAFDRVITPGDHWKAPIRRAIVVERTEDLFKTLKDIEEAVVFYTGSVPRITEVSATQRCFLVEAAGYYATIGA